MKAFVRVAVIAGVILLAQFTFSLFLWSVHAESFNPLNYPENWCLSYDGSDDYAYMGLSQVFRQQNFTFEAWIKPKYDIKLGSNSSYGHQYGVVVSCSSDDGTYLGTGGWWLQFDYKNGPLYFGWRYSSWYSFEYLAYPSNRAIWYNSSWYHVAVNFNTYLSSNDLKFYVNGTLDSQHTDANAIRYSTCPFQTGKFGASAYAGLIDEVRIWNGSRTQSQIQDAMSRTLSDSEAADPSLLGYWRFDEGTGTTSHDYSKCLNDAALAPSPADPQWFYPGADIVVPEFPSFLVLPLIMTLTVFVAVVVRRRLPRRL